MHNYLFEKIDNTFKYGPEFEEILDILKFLYLGANKNFSHIFVGASALSMDIYFLRKFLDKNYITNGVVYTGAHHSLTYIRLLIKYFDFKMTHVSYVKGNDINEAEEIIKKSKHENELTILFMDEPFGQCSNMSSFPQPFY
jgi:hypothetical protein